MLPKPDYGQRVIYTNHDGLSILGVIVGIRGNKITIKTDKGTRLTDELDQDAFQQVEYWRDYPKIFKNPEALEKYIDYTPLLSLFKSTKGVKLTIPLMRSMWNFINKHGFDLQLTEPKFLVTDTQQIRGLYSPGPMGGAGQLNLSSHAKNYALLFNTMAHEMCHQYNYQIELSEGLISNQDLKIMQGHGPVFDRIAKKIGTKFGIKIQRFNEGRAVIDGEVKDLDYSKEKRSAPYVFMLAAFDKDIVYGFKASNLVKAYTMIDDISHFLQRAKPRPVSTKIYGGVSRWARPKPYLYGKVEGRFKSLSNDITDLLCADAQDVDFLDPVSELKELMGKL